MPELPEVEAARLALEEHCVGKQIVRCSAAEDTKVIDGVAPSRLEAALVGRTIAAARRKGKNLWLVLDSPPHPSFQFGMAGAIYIKGVELSKYKRIHPMQSSSKISKEKCKALHRCIKEVIEKSVEVGADSNEFPENWIFHSREKKPGKAFVDGKKIDFVTVGGRTSAYVPELQILDGADAAAANRSKKGRDNAEENVGETSKKGQKAAPKEGGKAAQKTAVDEEEEDDKPAKRRGKGAKAPSKEVGDDHHEEQEDDEVEESKPTKRGTKRPAKKDGRSLDAGGYGGEDNEETVVAAKRPQRKKR